MSFANSGGTGSAAQTSDLDYATARPRRLTRHSKPRKRIELKRNRIFHRV